MIYRLLEFKEHREKGFTVSSLQSPLRPVLVGDDAAASDGLWSGLGRGRAWAPAW